MTTSAHEAAESWAADPTAPPAPGPYLDDWGRPLVDPVGQPIAPLDKTYETEQWQQDAYASAEGMSGRGVVALTGLAAGLCAGLDLALTSGRVTFFFDLCFVVICLVSTMAVRRSDLFTAGVLPPLLFAAVIAVLSVSVPDAFESTPGVSKVFLTGLADHAGGLVFGYGLALAAVAARIVTSNQRR